MCSSSLPWKRTAERGQANFVGSICLPGSVSQLGKQHSCAGTILPPQDQEQKPSTSKGQILPAAQQSGARQLRSLLGDGGEQSRRGGLHHHVRMQALGMSLLRPACFCHKHPWKCPRFDKQKGIQGIFPQSQSQQGTSQLPARETVPRLRAPLAAECVTQDPLASGSLPFPARHSRRAHGGLRGMEQERFRAPCFLECPHWE